MALPETALVVTPTSASPETREYFLSRFGPETAFADLAGLRRSGLGTLRCCHAKVVVVAGPSNELALFEDYLVGLSFLVPRARRERQHFGGEPARLGTRDLIRSCLRMAAGQLAGIAALAANAVRIRRFAG